DYFGVAYINKKNHEICIAHRGSISLYDRLGNLQIILNKVPRGQQFADTFSDAIKSETKKLDQVYALIHIGHSQAGVYAINKGLHDSARVITFDAPGSKAITEKYFAKQKKSMPTDFHSI